MARHPFHRSTFVLGVVGLMAAAWTAVLLWPGRAPLWLLAVVVLAMAVGGPTAMIGFDFARTFNPASRLGSAPADSSLDAYRWAFAVQYAVWALGAVQVVRYRRWARYLLAQRDPVAYDALRRGVIHPT